MNKQSQGILDCTLRNLLLMVLVFMILDGWSSALVDMGKKSSIGDWIGVPPIVPEVFLALIAAVIKGGAFLICIILTRALSKDKGSISCGVLTLAAVSIDPLINSHLTNSYRLPVMADQIILTLTSACFLIWMAKTERLQASLGSA